MTDRNLDAYYYSFEPTGCDLVDAVLEQVARAGKAFHSTDDWNEKDHDGRSPVEKMQAAADASASAILALIAENERLEQALSAPETITAEPAADYEALRKQFMSLRMLANSNARMVQHWRDQCGRETRETLLANAANVNAERDTNAMLIDALEAAEAERDQLRAEVATLRTLLTEAAEDIADWGAYAGEYFQQKHDLAGCVARYRAALGKGGRQDG